MKSSEVNKEALDDKPNVIIVEDVCSILQIDRHAVYKLIRSGKLSASKNTKGIWLIDKEKLSTFIDNGCDIPASEREKLRQKRIIYYEKILKKFPDIVTPKMLVDVLCVSDEYLFRRLKDGRIKTLHVGRYYKIPKEYLIDYLAGKEHQRIKKMFPYMV